MLADLVRLSPYHFLRSFKRSFGEPPHRHWKGRRIERAKALLANPRASITEVALDVGFSATGAFSAAFHRITGQTPTDYRRSLRSQFFARRGHTDVRSLACCLTWHNRVMPAAILTDVSSTKADSSYRNCNRGSRSCRSGSPTDRGHCGQTDLVWAAPPLCPDIIFGKDRLRRRRPRHRRTRHRPPQLPAARLQRICASSAALPRLDIATAIAPASIAPRWRAMRPGVLRRHFAQSACPPSRSEFVLNDSRPTLTSTGAAE